VRWLISRIYAFYQQTAKALRVALEGLEMNSVQAVLWAQAGSCHLALGLHGAAGNAFQQAEQLDPDCRPPLETRRALANPSTWNKLKGLWRRLLQK
jgi:tetratricopeptide (TPR) repeat protein